MKTLAVTAGLGPFAGFARRLALRFEAVNGIHCRVMGARDVRRLGASLASPMLAKLLAWRVVPGDAERIIWVDADCVPLAQLDALPCGPFAARPDFPGTREAAARTIPAAGTLPRYFNAGVFVATRDAEPAFGRLARDVSRLPADTFGDQTFLNLEVRRCLGGFETLPPEWNWRPDRDGPPHMGVRIIHVARGGRRFRRLARAWRIVENGPAAAGGDEWRA